MPENEIAAGGGRELTATGYSSAGPAEVVLTQLMIVAAIAAYLCTGLFSPIFYEHLTIGNWILANRAVPSSYLWSLSESGLPWSDTAWVFSLCLSLVENLLGEDGLLAAKALLFILFAASLAYLYQSRAKDIFLGTSIALIASCALLAQMPLSPALVGWTLLVLSLEFFYRFQEHPDSWLRWLIALSLIGLIHANIHGLSLVVIILLIFLGRDFKTKPAPSSTRKAMFLPVVVLLLLQFASPYAGRQAVFEIQGFINRLSLEVFYQLNPGTIYDFSLAFLLLLWVVLAVFWHYRSGSLSSSEIMLAAFTSIVGLGVEFVRPLALILTGMLISLVWGRTGGAGLGNLAEGFFRCRNLLGRLSPLGVIWVLLCLLIVNLVSLWRAPSGALILPLREVDYLQDKQLGFPVLHESLIGGYLVYRFADERGLPRHQATITHRASEIAPSAARQEALFNTLFLDWRELFPSLDPETAICRTHSLLYRVLEQDGSWQLVYENGEEILSAKRDLPKLQPRLAWAVFKRNRSR